LRFPGPGLAAIQTTPWGVEAYGCDSSKEPLNKCQIQENHPSETKARVDYAGLSGTDEAVPFQNGLIQSFLKEDAELSSMG
jgi:hypothetical protein